MNAKPHRDCSIWFLRSEWCRHSQTCGYNHTLLYHVCAYRMMRKWITPSIVPRICPSRNLSTSRAVMARNYAVSHMEGSSLRMEKLTRSLGCCGITEHLTV